MGEGADEGEGAEEGEGETETTSGVKRRLSETGAEDGDEGEEEMGQPEPKRERIEPVVKQPKLPSEVDAEPTLFPDKPAPEPRKVVAVDVQSQLAVCPPSSFRFWAHQWRNPCAHNESVSNGGPISFFPRLASGWMRARTTRACLNSTEHGYAALTLQEAPVQAPTQGRPKDSELLPVRYECLLLPQRCVWCEAKRLLCGK